MTNIELYILIGNCLECTHLMDHIRNILISKIDNNEITHQYKIQINRTPETMVACDKFIALLKSYYDEIEEFQHISYVNEGSLFVVQIWFANR